MQWWDNRPVDESTTSADVVTVTARRLSALAGATNRSSRIPETESLVSGVVW